MSQAAGVVGGTSGGIVWRDALVDFACATESPFILLAAPSGYGKSILAAQIASRYRSHETVDFEGRPFSADATMAALLRLLDAECVLTRPWWFARGSGLRGAGASPRSASGSVSRD